MVGLIEGDEVRWKVHVAGGPNWSVGVDPATNEVVVLTGWEYNMPISAASVREVAAMLVAAADAAESGG